MAILHGSWLLPHQWKDIPYGGQKYSEASAEIAARSPLPSERLGQAERDRPGCLFLWGETWRRITPSDWSLANPLPSSGADELPLHPFSMTIAELLEFGRSLQQAGHLRLPTTILEAALPTSEPAAIAAKRTRATSKNAGASSTALPIPLGQTQVIALPSCWVTLDSDQPKICWGKASCY